MTFVKTTASIQAPRARNNEFPSLRRRFRFGTPAKMTILHYTPTGADSKSILAHAIWMGLGAPFIGSLIRWQIYYRPKVKRSSQDTICDKAMLPNESPASFGKRGRLVYIPCKECKSIWSTIKMMRRSYGLASLWTGAHFIMLESLVVEAGILFGRMFIPASFLGTAALDLVMSFVLIPLRVLTTRRVCFQAGPVMTPAEKADWRLLYHVPNILEANFLIWLLGVCFKLNNTFLMAYLNEVSPTTDSTKTWEMYEPRVIASFVPGLLAFTIRFLCQLPLDNLVARSSLQTWGAFVPDADGRVKTIDTIGSGHHTFLPCRPESFVRAPVPAWDFRGRFSRLLGSLKMTMNEEGLWWGWYRGWPWQVMTWAPTFLGLFFLLVIASHAPRPTTV